MDRIAQRKTACSGSGSYRNSSNTCYFCWKLEDTTQASHYFNLIYRFFLLSIMIITSKNTPCGVGDATDRRLKDLGVGGTVDW